MMLTGESANCKSGLVPGARCGKNGAPPPPLSMLGYRGFEGFMSRMELIPFLSMSLCNWPKSSPMRPVDDFICILDDDLIRLLLNLRFWEYVTIFLFFY